MHEIRYTEPLVRRAVRRTILRLLGPMFFVALSLVAASVSIGIIRGDRGWFLGSMGTVLLLGVLAPVVAIRAHTRAAMSRFVQLENGRAAIELADGRLRLASKLGSVDLPLDRVTTVSRYPEFWVLLAGRSILMTIPTEGLPPEVLASWTDAFRTAGTTVA